MHEENDDNLFDFSSPASISGRKPNKSFHWIAGVSAALKYFGFTSIIITNKFTGNPATSELGVIFLVLYDE